MSIRYVEEALVEIQPGTNRMNRQATYLEAVLSRAITSLHAWWGDGVHQYSNRRLELAHISLGFNITCNSKVDQHAGAALKETTIASQVVV